jgi:type VI secretion system protein ImpM
VPTRHPARLVTEAVQTGLFGKLPVQGDFVRAGLPGSFVQPWDGWLQGVLSASRQLLGADWVPAWLEAPIWRFVLPEGMCGAGAVLGLMLPSVDRVGRYFPLTLAAVFTPGLAPDAAGAGTWLAAAEAAGLAALERDATLAEILAGLPTEPPPFGASEADALWWTDGGPRVAAGTLRLPTLPEAGRFATMLAGEPDMAVLPEAEP